VRAPGHGRAAYDQTVYGREKGSFRFCKEISRTAIINTAMNGIYEMPSRSKNIAACVVLDAIEAKLAENRAVISGASSEDTAVPGIAGAAPISGPEYGYRDEDAAKGVQNSGATPVRGVDSPDSTEVASRRSAFRTVHLQLSTKTPLFPFHGADPNSAEEYRLLRTRLLQHPAAPRMMVVSSASAGDGKTVTAINIAGILAMKSDVRVLLIDADMRRSSVAQKLGMLSGPGLAEVLRGECPLDDAIVCTAEMPNLHVIPAGATPSNPAELLDSSLWKSIAANLRDRFPYIVVDSTPIAAVADFELVQAVCDGIVVVIRPDHTNRKLFDAALKCRPADRILGVVINAAEDWPFARAEASYYGAYRQHNGQRRS
jgi:capsular exopolysaccharide synthesis family protein